MCSRFVRGLGTLCFQDDLRHGLDEVGGACPRRHLTRLAAIRKELETEPNRPNLLILGPA